MDEGMVVWRFHNLKQKAKELGFTLQYDTNGFALKSCHIGEDGWPESIVGYAKTLAQVEGFLGGLEFVKNYPTFMKKIGKKS